MGGLVLLHITGLLAPAVAHSGKTAELVLSPLLHRSRLWMVGQNESLVEHAVSQLHVKGMAEGLGHDTNLCRHRSHLLGSQIICMFEVVISHWQSRSCRCWKAL